MPIHGHTKIELTSQTTGEVETIEKDNIVTNAVSQIFNAFNGMALLREANANGEYGSTSDKSWELLESLYGGILLYDTALGSDPNTLFAPPAARQLSHHREQNRPGKRRCHVCLRLCHQPGQRHDRQRVPHQPLRRLLR